MSLLLRCLTLRTTWEIPKPSSAYLVCSRSHARQRLHYRSRHNHCSRVYPFPGVLRAGPLVFSVIRPMNVDDTTVAARVQRTDVPTNHQIVGCRSNSFRFIPKAEQTVLNGTKRKASTLRVLLPAEPGDAVHQSLLRTRDKLPVPWAYHTLRW
jgi:hypothetical protein